jgi:hypothetical protein
VPVLTKNPMDVIIGFDIKELDSQQMFKVAEALDAYEMEARVHETVVMDISEIADNAMVVVRVDPKKLITYDEIFSHIDAMISAALEKAGFKGKEYRIKKILFRTILPGAPSTMTDEVNDLKAKVSTLWRREFGDDMKSYV